MSDTPDRWPQNMRGHHLRESTRDAYWEVRDAERAAERPIADIMVFTTILGAVGFFAAMERHWIGYAVTSVFFAGWLIVVRISMRERRKLLPKVQAARQRLEELKSKGGEVRL